MITEGNRGIMPAEHQIHKQMDIAQVLLAEESVFVFLQLLGHVDDLLIVHQQLADVAANLIDPRQVPFFL